MKTITKVVFTIIGLCLYAATFSQNEAYRQLQEAAGTNSSYVVPVNGPVAIGEESSSNTTVDANAVIIAGYQQSSYEINNQGVYFHNQGNYIKAIRYYKKALWYNPYNEVARNNLKNAQEAKRIYKENIKIANNQNKKNAISINERRQQQQEIDKAPNNKEIASEVKEADKQLQEATKKLIELQTQVNNINRLLASYSKSLKNNSGELNKWSETIDKTYQNTLDVSKEYFMQIFLKYSLLTNFDTEYRNAAYKKLENILSTSDPKTRVWLMNELTSKNISPDQLETFVNIISTGTDAAGLFNEIFNGTNNQTKTNLDAVLFINSVFEATGLVKYEDLKDSPFFKQMSGVKGKVMPSDWFAQAKVVGEVYSDLVVQCVAWYNIDKLNEDTEIISNKVNLLISNQEQTINQISCIEKAINENNLNQVNKCTGKTKLHTPPPFLY